MRSHVRATLPQASISRKLLGQWVSTSGIAGRDAART
jgi:hypothetical protein